MTEFCFWFEINRHSTLQRSTLVTSDWSALMLLDFFTIGEINLMMKQVPKGKSLEKR